MRVPLANARRQLTVWARHVWHSAHASQLVEDKGEGFGGPRASWRYKEASDRQVQTYVKMTWAVKRTRDMQLRDSLTWLAAHNHHLTRGAVSDLLDVLFGMSRTGGWSPVIPIPKIPRAVRASVEAAR